MKFTKCDDIELMGNKGIPLPDNVKGLRSGPWTIHHDYHYHYIVSVQGLAIMDCWYASNARCAVRAFAALPLDWSMPLEELKVKVQEYKPQCLDIINKYRLVKVQVKDKGND